MKNTLYPLPLTSGVLDEQKALCQDMEENPTSQATTAVSEESDDRSTFIDYVDTNISAE